MFAVAGVSVPVSPDARARAIDHDHPIAKSTRSATARTLKTRSDFPDGRRNPRGRCAGNANRHSPVVALGRGADELERLSSIPPRKERGPTESASCSRLLIFSIVSRTRATSYNGRDLL